MTTEQDLTIEYIEPNFYIGQTFDNVYPDAAADWCNANGAQIVEKHKEVDTGMGIADVRYYEIEEIVEPTLSVEEKNEVIRNRRASLYTKLVDPLHAEKQRKVVLGEWTEEMEAEYVAKVKELTAKIQDENPYVELTVDNGIIYV